MIIVDNLLTFFFSGVSDLKYHHGFLFFFFHSRKGLIKPASEMSKYIIIGVEIVQIE